MSNSALPDAAGQTRDEARIVPAVSDEGITIVYDGECPFCASYVRLVRLRKAVGTVKLVDAREHTPEAMGLWNQGYDLDQGMALIRAGKVFYGAECLTQLALMSTRSGLFNRLQARLLSHPTVAKSAYPLLKAGRDIALWVLGRGRLLRSENAAQKQHPPKFLGRHRAGQREVKSSAD